MSAYFAVTRSMNVDQMTMGFSPTVDGKAVPRHPFAPTASDVSASVPLMLGSTRTELTTSADAAAFSLNEDGLRTRIQDLLGDHAGHVIDVYRKANPGATPSDLYFLIASDNRYGAPVMKIAERRAALQKGPVYLYYFRWETPIDGGRLKSPHTIEIPFAFDNIKTNRMTSGSPDAPALADKVSSAWIAFARTGNPNTPKLPQWPAFNPKDRPTMVFNNQSKVENDPLREQRVAMFSAMNCLTAGGLVPAGRTLACGGGSCGLAIPLVGRTWPASSVRRVGRVVGMDRFVARWCAPPGGGVGRRSWGCAALRGGRMAGCPRVCVGRGRDSGAGFLRGAPAGAEARLLTNVGSLVLAFRSVFGRWSFRPQLRGAGGGLSYADRSDPVRAFPETVRASEPRILALFRRVFPGAALCVAWSWDGFLWPTS